MTETNDNGTPKWYVILSIVFLLWNVMGLAAFFGAMSVAGNKEALENAGLNAEQVELTLATPAWVNIAFGVAVVFGVLGCIALVMKRKLATPLLIVSLAGVMAQNVYVFLLSDAVRIMGIGISPLVIAGAIALVPHAMYGTSKGWLK